MKELKLSEVQSVSGAHSVGDAITDLIDKINDWLQ